MTLKIENTFIYLIGLPGVGKLTIAKELSKVLGAKLLDNHKINNLVLDLALPEDWRVIPEACWVETAKIRKILLDVIVNLAPREQNYILTNVLLEGDKEDFSIWEGYLDVANARGGRIIPIVLSCDEEEHLKRISSTGRRENFKMTDGEILKKMFSNGKVPFKPEHEARIHLDITHLTPVEACGKIIEYLRALSLYENLQDLFGPL